MLIYAHRGSSGEEPENTLRAFKRALADGADGIEFDVHASADGIPVVIHDRELARTTNGQGRVSETTMRELRRLDAGDGEPIPSLEEVVVVAGDRLKLYIELKQQGAERAVLDVLHAVPETDWILASFDHQILREVRKLEPDAELWVISQSPSTLVVDIAREIAASTISLWSEATSPATAERLFAADLDLAVWTVNDIDVARQAQLLGASAICTDYPKRIRVGLEGNQSASAES